LALDVSPLVQCTDGQQQALPNSAERVSVRYADSTQDVDVDALSHFESSVGSGDAAPLATPVPVDVTSSADISSVTPVSDSIVTGKLLPATSVCDESLAGHAGLDGSVVLINDCGQMRNLEFAVDVKDIVDDICQSVKVPLSTDECAVQLHDNFYAAQRDNPTLQAACQLAAPGNFESFVCSTDRLLSEDTSECVLRLQQSLKLEQQQRQQLSPLDPENVKSADQDFQQFVNTTLSAGEDCDGSTDISCSVSAPSGVAVDQSSVSAPSEVSVLNSLDQSSVSAPSEVAVLNSVDQLSVSAPSGVAVVDSYQSCRDLEQRQQQLLFTLFRYQAIHQWLWQRQLFTLSLSYAAQQERQQFSAFHCCDTHVIRSGSDGLVDEVINNLSPLVVYVDCCELGKHTVADIISSPMAASVLGQIGRGTGCMQPPGTMGGWRKKRKWHKWALRRGRTKQRKKNLRKWASWRKKNKSYHCVACGSTAAVVFSTSRQLSNRSRVSPARTCLGERH
jgi:hypothetical protein